MGDKCMYTIGVDIGTTSTKSIIFDLSGNIIYKASQEYSISSPKPEYKEQNPKELLKAVIGTLRESISGSGINAKDIKFVSFSSMMHSIIAVDESGNELTQCIIWADNRSAEFADTYKRSGKGRYLYLRTGTPTHPMSPLYKLMWLKKYEPEIFNRAHKFISIKEYVFYHFFKKYIIDHSIASATGLFNIFGLKWDREALSILGISEAKLSEPVPTTFIINNLRKELCEVTGLTPETKFVVGASDGCLANLGSNAIEKGVAAATIGTSGAVRVVFDKPVTDPKERVFCYILSEDKYVVGGAINNGGVVFQWFRDVFSEVEIEQGKLLGIDPYILLNGKIKETRAGSDGLIFLPFLAGERAPYWNANLRGSFLGISHAHKKNHFARALIEGICFDMNVVLEAVKDLTGEVKCIYANGGFARSEEWVQILCDIMNVPTTLSDNYESSCLGAIMLGMVATGEAKNFEACSYLVRQGKVFTVRKEANEVYNTLYRIYKNSIDSMTPVLEQLAKYQKL
jgi:gluconokinase